MSLPSHTLGEYRLVAPLGSGGMGDVYRAEHVRLGRTVALKVLRDRDGAARFLSEARLQARLSHPAIATLYDYFEVDGRACIAMELVEGETLADRLARLGPRPYVEAVGLLRPVTEAVAFLHARGVIHRDIKAHNVKRTPEGTVKLLDFGIAKDLALPGLTRAGMVPGTPAALSPEQVRGHAPDARSDVWALGVLLYELVTGALPFDAPDLPALYAQITTASFVPPSGRMPGVPEACDRLVARCLAADPARRFPDAGALLAALPDASGAGAPLRAVAPKSAAAPKRARPFAIRPPMFSAALRGFLLAAIGVVIGVVVGVLVLVGVGGWVYLHDRAAPAEPPAVVRPADAVPAQVTIDTFGPPAEVYRHGVRLGQTPLALDTYVGETVELTLRRGTVAETVRFETGTGRRAYSFDLPSR